MRSILLDREMGSRGLVESIAVEKEAITPNANMTGAGGDVFGNCPFYK